MVVEARTSSRTRLARAGFADTTDATDLLGELAALTGTDRGQLIADAALAGDPDAALRALVRIARREPGTVATALRVASVTVWKLLGASTGFADFYARHPGELADLGAADPTLPTPAELRRELREAVGADADGFAATGEESAWVALRVRYRRLLARIAAFDLRAASAIDAVPAVAATLADAAGAALEAALCVARTRLSTRGIGGSFPRAEVRATALAIIGMGKTGARELNYVSDVDVIFVGGPVAGCDAEITEARAVEIATRLAVETMRAITEIEAEPPLWEVDANLRPEGKQGALVRSLGAHVAYYRRWAHSWEFQALLKARPIAGDEALGREYLAAVGPLVWTSAARENFVEGVQRMRERVTEHIPPADVPYQLKLGPGGIRDIEFTVQLLQLVHGLADDSIRQTGTLDALDALVTGGYIGRADADVFARDYRTLRVLEHRVQLAGLRRTHLMPRTPDEQRALARASGLAASADGIWRLWEAVRREVREIHVRLFYRPLLSAVAAIGSEDYALAPAQAHDRLAAIGFGDPAGALRHIAALTSGLSRKVTIQRHLMPVMLRWFADGVDPDAGLVAFRRVSERLGETPWFLRLLRDSAGAAERLTRVLSASRYIGDLMEWIPESVAWLDSVELLRPRSPLALQREVRAIAERHAGIDDETRAVRALRRRELLRLAMAGVLDTATIEELAAGLTTVSEVTIQATLRAVRREVVGPADAEFEFAVVAMGRFGGGELGFGSDADVLFVYDAHGVDPQRAHSLAVRLVNGIRDRSDDARAPFDLDADLRPEGRNGPIARSLDAYAEYYRRWSLSWEAQALLRARGIAGSAPLLRRFTALADEIRYPEAASPQGLREIKRIKARVENERLPQGVDPRRHLKLGPGGLSDVEWLVQLLQLQHGRRLPALRTRSTTVALAAAREAGLVPDAAADHFAQAWRLASRLRSAYTLLTGQTSDALPTDRGKLDGIGRLLGYPPRSATAVDEDWARAARRARRDFERLFYA